jgi:hypothetical protein
VVTQRDQATTKVEQMRDSEADIDEHRKRLGQLLEGTGAATWSDVLDAAGEVAEKLRSSEQRRVNMRQRVGRAVGMETHLTDSADDATVIGWVAETQERAVTMGELAEVQARVMVDRMDDLKAALHRPRHPVPVDEAEEHGWLIELVRGLADRQKQWNDAREKFAKDMNTSRPTLVSRPTLTGEQTNALCKISTTRGRLEGMALAARWLEDGLIDKFHVDVERLDQMAGDLQRATELLFPFLGQTDG